MTRGTPHHHPILEFLHNDAEEEEGLGHAGIETYRDEPYASVAREVGQNSRDAFASLPVRIRFDLLTVPFAQIPALDTLRTTVASCLAQAKDEKEKEFFKRASQVLSDGPLKVLRIADSNTTGVKGPSKPGTPFHSLVKGSGVSKKEHDTSGGSFGIGKNAAYAISDIQTVFYSTVYIDEPTKEQKFLAQGKAVLVSHKDAHGALRRQSGYWGYTGFQPVDDPEAVPEWLRRKEIGTSVFALGFHDKPGWQQRITYSLLQNFFYAIHNGEMEFALDGGKIEITKMTLGPLFEDPAIREVAKTNDRDQEFELSRSLYQCLVSPDAKEQIVEIEKLGKIRIRVLVADGLPKKVCIIRNGMVITDSLEHFGDRLSRFPMHRDFVALVVPLDDEGRSFIKKLENPKHDGLSAERLTDKTKVDQAKAVMKKLAKAIRETIKSYTFTDFDSEVAADELRRYFATETSQTPDNSEKGPDDPETVRYVVEPKKPRKRQIAVVPGEEGGGGGGEDEWDGPGPVPPGPEPGPEPGPGPGPWVPGPRGARPVILSDVRNIVRSDPRKRTIFLTSPETGTAQIIVEATGINSSESLVVKHASGSAISQGKIKRRLVANERTQIDVEFAEDYRGPLELKVSIEPEVGAANEN